MQYGIVINRDGFIVDRCVILDDENRPQYYELQEGEQAIPFDENNNFTEYIKQKWNENEWIEGATQEEIDEYNANLPDPQPQKPTETEKLQTELANTNAMLLEFMETMLM